MAKHQAKAKKDIQAILSANQIEKCASIDIALIANDITIMPIEDNFVHDESRPRKAS